MNSQFNKLKVVYKDPRELKSYENYTRKSDDTIKYVRKSIREFGFKVPVLLEQNDIIVSGQVRVTSAVKENLKEIPCIYINDLNDEQIKAFRLIDNKVTEFSHWDFKKLEEELKNIDFDMLDFSMSDFGFSVEDIDIEVEDDNIDFDIDTIKEPSTSIGEVFKLGRHYLMCGDSTNKDHVAKLVSFSQKPMDLLITDPPYNVDYEGKTKDKLKIDNDNLEKEEFISFLTSAFKNANKVLKPGACFYIWYASKETHSFYTACMNAGFEVRQELIWEKQHFVIGRQDYQWIHEPCLYGWTEGNAHYWNNDRTQTTIMKFDRPNTNDLHPTMKPVKLFDYQIRNNTKQNDNVLDLFGGSGTTLIACEQNKRNAFVMEYDPKYVEVIKKRYEDLTGKKAVNCDVF